jgi:hypothetical protein
MTSPQSSNPPDHSWVVIDDVPTPEHNLIIEPLTPAPKERTRPALGPGQHLVRPRPAIGIAGEGGVNEALREIGGEAHGVVAGAVGDRLAEFGVAGSPRGWHREAVERFHLASVCLSHDGNSQRGAVDVLGRREHPGADGEVHLQRALAAEPDEDLEPDLVALGVGLGVVANRLLAIDVLKPEVVTEVDRRQADASLIAFSTPRAVEYGSGLATRDRPLGFTNGGKRLRFERDAVTQRSGPSPADLLHDVAVDELC